MNRQINQKTATIIIAAVVLILGGGLVYFNFLRSPTQSGGPQEAQPAAPNFTPATGGNEAAPAAGPGAPAAGAMGGGR